MESIEQMRVLFHLFSVKENLAPTDNRCVGALHLVPLPVNYCFCTGKD
jgi:hypothetical protein